MKPGDRVRLTDQVRQEGLFDPPDWQPDLVGTVESIDDTLEHDMVARVRWDDGRVRQYDTNFLEAAA